MNIYKCIGLAKDIRYGIEKQYDIKYNNDKYKLTKKNIVYKNKYNGKRCFILGNGPSLNNVDFKRLGKEYVFTVNRLMLHERFKDLKSNFHVWMDGAAFGFWKEFKFDTNITYNELSLLDDDVDFFFPVEAYDFCRRKGLIKKKDNIYYIKADEFIDAQRDYNGGKYLVDVSYRVPCYRTVVQYAVVIAIYMGFNEIYLLGCDGTELATTLDLARNKGIEEMHAYSDDDGEQEKWTNEALKKIGITKIMYEQYAVFSDYIKLVEVCKKRKIKFYNLTEGSLIDTIPKKNLDDILLC